MAFRFAKCFLAKIAVRIDSAGPHQLEFIGIYPDVRAQKDMRQPQFALSSNGEHYRRGGSTLVNDASRVLAPAKPVLRIINKSGSLAKLAAIGCKDSWSVQSHML